ncbi:MAG: carboxypeptidase regulatory-like domain-containing protein [Kofleriaceae bacterium]|nr:carboxypeptidase regulatory-like domain-containing protein [Kofleriaceae bacterium]
MLRRASVALLFLTIACGPEHRGGDDGVSGGDAGPPDAPCLTSISGKVFAPNGTLPLYNVMVYVPENPPVAFPEGVQCTSCASDVPGGAIAKAITGTDGSFKLEGVPPGENIPIIITTGKWRRRLTVPFVGQCVDLPIQDGTFRLPKNRSEGEIPRIAMVAGGCDGLGCILTKLGIDPSEFGTDINGPQRIVWFQGVGGTSPATLNATSLWGDLETMKKFDIILNSCECDVHNENKTSPDLLRQYADLGGRVFGSHFHYTWTRTLIPQWAGTANWQAGSSGTPDLVDMSHPAGQALATWLQTVGASTTLGQVTLSQKTPAVGAVTPPTVRWLYAGAASNPTTHYLSFQTPVGAEPKDQCGKVVYAGMHVASGTVNASFPSGCNAAFTPDEKALVFLLFDLTACVDIIL